MYMIDSVARTTHNTAQPHLPAQHWGHLPEPGGGNAYQEWEHSSQLVM